MKSFFAITGLLFILTACGTLSDGFSQPAAQPKSAVIVADAAQTPDASNKLVVPPWPKAEEATNQTRQPSEQIFMGSEAFLHKRPRSAKARAAEGDIVLNFVNADIQEVTKAILGEMLHLNYTISPSIQGAITIKINRPISKDEVLPVLSTVFRLNGAAIIESGGVVKVVPIAEASKQGAFLSIANRAGSVQGFGTQIVSLRYVDADEMKHMLEQMAPAGSVIPVDAARNILILAGTDDERAAMMDLVQTFDTDWLSGMSFGLFPLKDGNAKSMVNQLWEVLGTPTGPLAKIVRLVALDQQNAVLAISSQPRYIKEVKKWVERLDLNQAPLAKKMWVYAVQNGRAGDLAETLNKLVEGPETRTSSASKNNNSSSIPVPPPLPVSTLAEASNSPMPSPSAAPQQGQGDLPEQGLRIIADESTNSLIFMGTKAEFSLIEEALKKLDIIPLQVRIEAVIAEVTLTDDLRYGIQYLFKNKNVGGVLTNASTVSVSPSVPGFSAFITSSQISAVLDLLQSVTTVHVISSPQLMVLNNQTAVLQIGDQVPVATQSAVSVLTPGAPVVNSIQMKDTGIILKVTPRVNASGMVVMDISQEVSDVAKTTTSNLDSPTIQQRKIASSVAVRDGETVALGGLIKDSVTDGKDGIPILQDIPVAGSLFGTTSKSTTRTELLALITPRVIKNDVDLRNITKEMREQMNAVTPLDAKIHATPVQ